MTQELKTILYVEDDLDIQEIAIMALEMVGGFQLLVCSSGQEALDKAATSAPDMFLLDVMMPGMDGPTTLEKLRKVDAFKATPTVFMTAKVMESEIAEYIEKGAIGVISKPFDPMTLAERIKVLWDTHHQG